LDNLELRAVNFRAGVFESAIEKIKEDTLVKDSSIPV